MFIIKLLQNAFSAKAISFKFVDDKCVFTLKEEGNADIIITNGMNYWIREGNIKPFPHSLFSLRKIDFDSIVAASTTLQNENTLLLTWRFIETVDGDTLSCVFDGDKLKISFLFIVARLQKKPDDRVDITGSKIHQKLNLLRFP